MDPCIDSRFDIENHQSHDVLHLSDRVRQQALHIQPYQHSHPCYTSLHPPNNTHLHHSNLPPRYPPLLNCQLECAFTSTPTALHSPHSRPCPCLALHHTRLLLPHDTITPRTIPTYRRYHYRPRRSKSSSSELARASDQAIQNERCVENKIQSRCHGEVHGFRGSR